MTHISFIGLTLPEILVGGSTVLSIIGVVISVRSVRLLLRAQGELRRSIAATYRTATRDDLEKIELVVNETLPPKQALMSFAKHVDICLEMLPKDDRVLIEEGLRQPSEVGRRRWLQRMARGTLHELELAK